MSEPTEGTPEHRRMIAVDGHPGIYRKGQRYLVRWRHKGKLKSKSFRTLSEADRFKARTVAGDTRPTSREPFPAYAERWLSTYTGRTRNGLAPSTRASYEDAVVRVLVPYFKRTRLADIDPPLVRDFIASLAGKGYAPSTVRRYVAVLRACLGTAYEDGLIPANPTVRVVVTDRRTAQALTDDEQAKSKTDDTGRRKRLTAEQTRDLLAAMPAEHADLAYFLAGTGCRISEALAARWQDVTTDNGRPVLVVAVSKTRAGRRKLSLTPALARRLTKRRATTSYRAAEDPIFPTEDGTPFDPHNYRRRIFNPVSEAAGVPWATPHDLRHGLATLMAERGWSAAKIAGWLGHADGGVLALRTYIHAEVEDAPDFMDGLMSGEG